MVFPRAAQYRRPLIAPVKWLTLILAVAALAGSASAAFLAALDWATATRLAHPWLLAGLPLAGWAVAWVYWRIGQPVEAGNNLLIDEIHQPRQPIPLRMAPLIWLGTVIAHLFGASVGREGAAVQMGGALADQIAQRCRLDTFDRQRMLLVGISAGFASVFGTPLAGAVFALEVLALGRVRADALLPCLLAALLADQVCLAWGAQHAHHTVAAIPALSPATLAAILLAGALFGLAGRSFAHATHGLGQWLKNRVSYPPLRPLLGGALVAGLAWTLGGERFLGLGLGLIDAAFTQPLGMQEAAGKWAFTVLSLASGFKGGEVTPLFAIGATLGNTLAPLLALPVPLLAGIGLVAVFAGAANTPLACTLMAMELFGSGVGVYAALACAASYACSGHHGIYRAQRVDAPKHRPVL
jgi:H+/Cl- antiporter ClcA